jgi:hypothetical protein
VVPCLPAPVLDSTSRVGDDITGRAHDRIQARRGPVR